MVWELLVTTFIFLSFLFRVCDNALINSLFFAELLIIWLDCFTSCCTGFVSGFTPVWRKRHHLQRFLFFSSSFPPTHTPSLPTSLPLLSFSLLIVTFLQPSFSLFLSFFHPYFSFLLRLPLILFFFSFFSYFRLPFHLLSFIILVLPYCPHFFFIFSFFQSSCLHFLFF